MARKANDGTEFTNQMAVNHHNARLAAGTVKPMTKPAPDQQKSIEDDPVAMRAVETLKRLGYTGEDVEQAMGGDQQQGGGEEATRAAGMQIPGLQ